MLNGSNGQKINAWVESRIGELERNTLTRAFQDTVRRAAQRTLRGLAAVHGFERGQATLNAFGDAAVQTQFVARTTAGSAARASSPPGVLAERLSDAAGFVPNAARRTLSALARGAARASAAAGPSGAASAAPATMSAARLGKRRANAASVTQSSAKRVRASPGLAGLFRKTRQKHRRVKRGRRRSRRRSRSTRTSGR